MNCLPQLFVTLQNLRMCFLNSLTLHQCCDLGMRTCWPLDKIVNVKGGCGGGYTTATGRSPFEGREKQYMAPTEILCTSDIARLCARLPKNETKSDVHALVIWQSVKYIIGLMDPEQLF